MSEVLIQSNLSAFNSTLERYMAFTSKTQGEVLEHKGRDLGIKLYQGFAAHRWNGPRAGRGIAWRELKRRSALGSGIRLRPGIVASDKAPETYMAKRRLRGKAGTLRKLLVPQKTSRHQKKVFAELSLRQGGIGVLAASFLWFRRRSSQARGTYYMRNRKGRDLGFVNRGSTFFQIAGLTEGLAEISERHGIEATALANAREDMVTYFNERHLEAYRQVFGENPR